MGVPYILRCAALDVNGRFTSGGGLGVSGVLRGFCGFQLSCSMRVGVLKKSAFTVDGLSLRSRENAPHASIPTTGADR
jgi:hypothetical protein